MREIRLTLPVPPSKNDLTRRMRTGRGGWRDYPTPKKLKFVRDVKLKAKLARVEPIDGPISFDLVVYRGEVTKKRGGKQLQRMDLPNYEEILYDALQGVAYSNDYWIREKRSRLLEDRSNPRVEVVIRGLPTLNKGTPRGGAHE